jgi:hypothetical protein
VLGARNGPGEFRPPLIWSVVDTHVIAAGIVDRRRTVLADHPIALAVDAADTAVEHHGALAVEFEIFEESVLEFRRCSRRIVPFPSKTADDRF